MTAVAAVALALIAAPRPALAHGDARLVDRAIEIAPGGALRFDAEVHYHRIIGRIAVDGTIAVTLIRLDDGEPVLERQGREVQLNDLIRCCDDRGWTPHALVIENPGAETVRGHARASLIHDDVAVMVYGAESFTRESVVLFGAIWITVLWRARRRPQATNVRRTLIPLLIVAAASVGLGALGTLMYGVAGVPGYLAALASLSFVPANPIFSGVSMLLAVTMFGWGFAARRWAISDRVIDPIPWMALGLALIASVAIVAALIATAYDSAGIPTAAAIVAAAPLLGVTAFRLREWLGPT